VRALCGYVYHLHYHDNRSRHQRRCWVCIHVHNFDYVLLRRFLSDVHDY
jgi:hypothetical protein